MDVNIMDVLSSYCRIDFRKIFTDYVPAISVIEDFSQLILDNITHYTVMMEFDGQNYLIDLFSNSVVFSKLSFLFVCLLIGHLNFWVKCLESIC